MDSSELFKSMASEFKGDFELALKEIEDLETALKNDKLDQTVKIEALNQVKNSFNTIYSLLYESLIRKSNQKKG